MHHVAEFCKANVILLVDQRDYIYSNFENTLLILYRNEIQNQTTLGNFANSED